MKKLIASLILATSTIPSYSYEYNFEPHPSDEDLTWMIKNIYFEAGNQGTAGRVAVMMVTLNRVIDKRFPNTIKGVVTQGGQRLHRCQFSWYCDGKTDNIHDWKTFNEIKQLVLTSMPVVSMINDITDGATYYHADYVHPRWAKRKKKTIKIGDHIFYKDKQ